MGVWRLFQVLWRVWSCVWSRIGPHFGYKSHVAHAAMRSFLGCSVVEARGEISDEKAKGKPAVRRTSKSSEEEEARFLCWRCRRLVQVFISVSAAESSPCSDFGAQFGIWLLARGVECRSQ